MRHSELRLSRSADATRRARRYVARCLADWGSPDLCDDAALAATELVGNVLLHTDAEPRLVLSETPQGVRLAVHDSSRTGPLPGLVEGGSEEAMTGRGLGLVAGVAARCGVDRTPYGKAVWCDLVSGAPHPGQRDPWPVVALDRSEGSGTAPRFPVRLPQVPTRLLLAAKVHVDNLVREFTLVGGRSFTRLNATPPPGLAGLVERVTGNFAEARAAIKQQAFAAARRGDGRVELVLELPESAAAAGEAYLRGLEEADAYSRAERLLTLESPPQHVVFRRWYVHEIARQLRARAAGDDPGPGPELETRLLEELEAAAAARRTAERVARLQTLTSALAAAFSSEDVARAVLGEGMAALGAVGGAMLLKDSDRLGLVGAVGYPPDVTAGLRQVPLASPLPTTEVLRTGEPVWVESKADRDARFPELAESEPGTTSLCVVPLGLDGRVLGAIRFSFRERRLFGTEEREFTHALAAQAVQALDRARLYEAEQQARARAQASAERLARLQQVTSRLSDTLHPDEVGRVALGAAVENLDARLGSLSLVDGSGEYLELVGTLGLDAGMVDRWRRFRVDAALPGSEAVRTRRLVVVPTRAERDRRYPGLAGVPPLTEHTLVCVPLVVEDRPLGVFTLTFAHPRRLEVEDLSFLAALGQQCAQALERGRLLERERRAHEQVAAARDRQTFLARAGAELAGSLDVGTLLGLVGDLVVPAFADWFAADLLDGASCRRAASTKSNADSAPGSTAGSTAGIVPPLGEGPVWRTPPLDPDHAVRTGHAQIVPSFAAPDLQADGNPHLADLGAQGVASAVVLPLSAGDRAFGALTLVTTRASGRTFGAADLTTAQELASLVSLALEKARLYAEQSAAARELQSGLLPAELPDIPGAEVAARYRPFADSEVGGDFLDVFPLRRTTWGVVIGDICGTGPQAAALASLCRHTMRGLAWGGARPRAVLAGLNSALLAAGPGERFCTAIYGEVRPEADGLRILLASGGHPPPLLLRADGEVETIPLQGGLLGAWPQTQIGTCTVRVATSELLALYTDGVVEAREAGPAQGAGAFFDESGLRAALAASAGRPAGHVAARVEERAGAFAGGRPADDMAVLVIRAVPRPAGTAPPPRRAPRPREVSG